MGLLSYSQLNTMRYCGEQLRLQKLSFPEKPAVYLAGGTAFHKVSESIDGEDYLTEDEVKEIWHDVFKAELDKGRESEPDFTKWRRAGRKSIALPDKEDVGFWWSKGQEMCLAYRTHRYAENAWPILEWDGVRAIELAFQLNLSDEFVVRGSIDRVLVAPSGELVVCDLKTGKDPFDAMQLGTYALAIEQMYGMRPRWGTYYLAREGDFGKIRDLGRFSTKFLTREYTTVHRQREQGLYLASPGTHCVACGVREGCASADGSLSDDYDSLLPDY